MSAFIQVTNLASDRVAEENLSIGEYVVTPAFGGDRDATLEPKVQGLRSKIKGGHGSNRRSFRKTLRRLRGFVVSFEGLETRVVFVDGPTQTEYWLPTKYLRTNRITERGQPFEMDEFEERIPGMGLITGTEFRPMASASTMEIKVADLSEEDTELRNAILANSRLAAEG